MGAKQLETFLRLNKEYQKNPAKWMHDILGVKTLEPYQHKILDAVVRYDQVLVYATHSVSKTWTMARVALWFYSVYSDSIVITTAPTARQVTDLLWGEIREAFKGAIYRLHGRLLDNALKFKDKWYMKGFSPKKGADAGSKEQQGSSFQGYHSENILIIFDEAVGITHDVWVMADGLLTSGKVVKFVGIANPTTRNSEFFNRTKLLEYKKVKLTCFDSPNLVANGFTDKDSLEAEIDRLRAMPQDEALSEISKYKKPVSYLLSAQWVVTRVMKWGMNHPLSLSKAFGEFPEDDENVAIKYSHIQASVARSREIQADAERLIGVDVARYGADKSVITDLIGYVQDDICAIEKRATTEVTGQLIRLINDSAHVGRPTKVLIDCTGIGSGVHDELKEAQRENIVPAHIQIVEIHFGQGFTPKENDSKEKKKEAKRDAKEYSNMKAKMFDKLGQDIENHLALMPEDEYLEELPTIMFSYDTKGRMVIESKKDYKKRTGKASPDYSDSLALANLGRYIDNDIGTFKGHPKKTPLTKTKNRKDSLAKIGARIKSTEF